MGQQEREDPNDFEALVEWLDENAGEAHSATTIKQMNGALEEAVETYNEQFGTDFDPVEGREFYHEAKYDEAFGRRGEQA